MWWVVVVVVVGGCTLYSEKTNTALALAFPELVN